MIIFLFKCLDAKVDEFIKNVQEQAADNYAVIYTSSSAKKSVRGKKNKYTHNYLLKIKERGQNRN